jgi:hypothetical protein
MTGLAVRDVFLSGEGAAALGWRRPLIPVPSQNDMPNER